MDSLAPTNKSPLRCVFLGKSFPFFLGRSRKNSGRAETANMSQDRFVIRSCTPLQRLVRSCLVPTHTWVRAPRDPKVEAQYQSHAQKSSKQCCASAAFLGSGGRFPHSFSSIETVPKNMFMTKMLLIANPATSSLIVGSSRKTLTMPKPFFGVHGVFLQTTMFL